MIDYDEVKRGDILKLVGLGAPRYAEVGDLLRITTVNKNGVFVEDRYGKTIEFVFNGGAARLESTMWKGDFLCEDADEEKLMKEKASG